MFFHDKIEDLLPDHDTIHLESKKLQEEALNRK